MLREQKNLFFFSLLSSSARGRSVRGQRGVDVFGALMFSSLPSPLFFSLLSALYRTEACARARPGRGRPDGQLAQREHQTARLSPLPSPLAYPISSIPPRRTPLCSLSSRLCVLSPLASVLFLVSLLSSLISPERPLGFSGCSDQSAKVRTDNAPHPCPGCRTKGCSPSARPAAASPRSLWTPAPFAGGA